VANRCKFVGFAAVGHLARIVLAWMLRGPRVILTLIGASSMAQLEDSLGAMNNREFSCAELAEIDQYAMDGQIHLWTTSGAV